MRTLADSFFERADRLKNSCAARVTALCLEGHGPYSWDDSNDSEAVCIPCRHAFAQVGARAAATSLKMRSDGREEAQLLPLVG